MVDKVDFYYLKGKGSWCQRLFTPDMEYGVWSVKLSLDAASVDLFKTLQKGSEDIEGIKNEIKEDDDGFYVVIRRPIKKEYKDRNGRVQEIHFEPPVVVDVNNHPWDPRVAIGNGSDLTVKIERYKYNVPFKKGKKGTAIRLKGVRVDNLIPYDQESYTDDQKKAVEGLDTQPLPKELGGASGNAREPF